MTNPVIIGDATLYLGDCMDILPTLGNFDAVITDPPYGINFKYEGEYKDAPDSYSTLIKPLKGLPVALLQYPEEMMRLVCPVLGAPDECLIWAYNSNLPRQSRIWGFWNLPVDFRKVRQPAKNADASKVKNANAASYDWLVDINLIKGNGLEKTAHPCQIPVELMIRVILLTSATVVLDPFMGSGSTAIAALKLGRKFIGIEREPKYFDIACQRIERAVAQGQLFAPEPVKQIQEAMF